MVLVPLTVIIAPLGLVRKWGESTRENRRFSTYNRYSLHFIYICIYNQCSRRGPGPYYRRSGSEECAGTGVGGRFWGGPPKRPVGGVVSTTVPPEGGVGPKKRHLVLYKLAGFRHADRQPWRPIFARRMRKQKIEKVRFLHIFAHFRGGTPH